MHMTKILRKIADENGITVEEMREEMQKAINEAWRNPPDDGDYKSPSEKSAMQGRNTCTRRNYPFCIRGT